LWLPILSGSTRSAAQSVIADIALSVDRSTREVGRDWSLGSGLPGIAVFRSYLDGVDGRSGPCAEVEAMLAGAFQACELNSPTASLYGGMAGIGWAMGLCGRLAGQPGLRKLSIRRLTPSELRVAIGGNPISITCFNSKCHCAAHGGIGTGDGGGRTHRTK
jgi:hypothetical protein